MKRKSHSRARRTTTKSVLRLPDLEHAKAAVLNSLSSPDAQRGYRHAIDEFVVSVVPVFIGDGIPLIARRHRHVPLDLQSVERFEDGVVQLRWRPLNACDRR